MKPKIPAPSFELINKTLNIINRYDVNTVCYSSKCPNISECFNRGTATFMILGNICTRNCRFCNVKHSKPDKIDQNEPVNIAKSVKELNLKYAVLTSVDRDDLKDYGSLQFVKTINEILKLNPDVKIECLTPDFKGDINSLNLLSVSHAYKLAHNIETVQRLHKTLKPGSSYTLSLNVLEYYSRFKTTKSSIIVGFGEDYKEIEKTMKDLRNAGVSQLTIGQYLQPTTSHFPVKKYYSEEEFRLLENLAYQNGFEAVVSGPLIRSSYYADKL